MGEYGKCGDAPARPAHERVRKLKQISVAVTECFIDVRSDGSGQCVPKPVLRRVFRSGRVVARRRRSADDPVAVGDRE